MVGGGSGVGGGGSVGGVIGGPLTADSRNLSSKLSLSSLARSTSKAKFVSVASSASLEPHKDLTALVDRQEEEHRQEVEEQQLGTTFNPSFNLSIPNRSYLNTVPSQLSVPRDDSVPYVNSYVPSGGVPGSLAGSGGDVMSHVTGSGGGWPSTNGGGWGAPDLPAAGERGNDGGRHQWPGADPRARGNKSLLEFVGDILYRKGPPRERWKLGRKLGEGGNSRVYEAVHVHDGTRAAVKVIDKQLLSADQAERRLWYEVYAFKLLGMSGGHPNIVELLEVGEDAEYVYLCMELLVGGELFSRITDQGQYTEKHAAALVEAMLSALRLCHDLNITHRDVKPENWVFTDTGPDAVVKLIDFGICFYSEDPTALCRSIIGTPLYVAPEVLLRQPYGPEADLWSLVRCATVRRVGVPMDGCQSLRCAVTALQASVSDFWGVLCTHRVCSLCSLMCLTFILVFFRPCSLWYWLFVRCSSLNVATAALVFQSPPPLLCRRCVLLRVSLCTLCYLGGHPLTTLTKSSSSRRSSTIRLSLPAATGCSSQRKGRIFSPGCCTRTHRTGWTPSRRSSTGG